MRAALERGNVIIGNADRDEGGSYSFVGEPLIFGFLQSVDSRTEDTYDGKGGFTQLTQRAAGDDSTQTLVNKQERVAQSVEQRTFNP